jgi:hypothetical protein
MAIDINIPIEDAVTDGSLNPVTSNAVFDALAALPSGTVTSVGLTMPSAFTVANSPITSSGDIAVTGAGVASQYVRGDGSLANFPTSSGGGASVSYYLNGSVAQGTFGGVAMREMNKVPVIGAGTDFTISSNGYIQSFITDANDPNQLEIPAGNWNFETYFSASSSGGNPSFYIELYKWDGATLSLIASNSINPEIITGGTATDLYISALAVPQTTLALTDRLAIRIYVNNSGRTIKLHTENSNLSQIITTFSTGLTSLNGITAQVQNLATGTSGSDFAINSSGSTHTFNLPTASAANRGALSTADWTTFNSKQAALVSATNIKTVNGNSLLGSGDLVISGGGGVTVGTTAVTSGTVGRVFFQGTGDVVQQDAGLSWNNTNKKLTVANSFALNGSAGTGFTSMFSIFRGATEVFKVDEYKSQFTGSVYMNSIVGTGVDAILFGNQSGGGNLITMSPTQGKLAIGYGSPTYNAALDVRAQGALSTDVALRVRNSANTANFVEVNGNGTFRIGDGNGGLNNSISYLSDGRLFLSKSGGNFIELNGGTTKNRLFGGANGWEIGGTAGSTFYSTNITAFLFDGTLQIASGLNVSGGATNTIHIENGIAPTGVNPSNQFKFYSADITAGNAAPHFRTENGDIIKLYKQSSAGILTVPQLVTVLQNLGLLS